jgi:NAD(P)-dependent dehydrogenase (short-subunit alcohol dehydrogenase family)
VGAHLTGAITSFSKGLAIDEALGGVRVNVVSPGNIWTPLWKSWSDGENNPEAAREAGDRVQVMVSRSRVQGVNRAVNERRT